MSESINCTHNSSFSNQHQNPLEKQEEPAMLVQDMERECAKKFRFEKAVLLRVIGIQNLIKGVKQQLIKGVIKKSGILNQRIPEQLKLKMFDGSKVEKVQDKSFSCKHCLKSFKDGRQLGGHISRAHPSNTQASTKTKRIKKSKKSEKKFLQRKLTEQIIFQEPNFQEMNKEVAEIKEQMEEEVPQTISQKKECPCQQIFQEEE